MKLIKFSNWFYLNDDKKFKNIQYLLPKIEETDYILDDKDFLGRIFFEACTTRKGKRGYGTVYCATTMGLQELKRLPAKNYEEFISYFSEIIESSLCNRIKSLLKKKARLQDIVRYLKSQFGVKRISYTRAMSEFMEGPNNYLGRFLSIPTAQGKTKSLNEIEKFLHQAFVLFKIIQATHPQEVITKNIVLEQRKAMQSGIKKLDFMMPVTWYGPTVKMSVNGNIYSIWHEFSAPSPTLTGGTHKRFDIIVQRGDFDSMFPQKPNYDEISGMSVEQFSDLPNRFFREMRKIDLMIECKEQNFEKWKDDIDTQIIPYKETCEPNKMLLISACRIPENVVSKLGERGIMTIAAFNFESEELYTKEKELENIVKTLK